ncbi:MAG: hypothetical protein WB586_17045 [Chthoniobacterales bacterium]
MTVYLENGGRLEHAQQMAGHDSPRTTKLYLRSCTETRWANGMVCNGTVNTLLFFALRQTSKVLVTR